MSALVLQHVYRLSTFIEIKNKMQNMYSDLLLVIWRICKPRHPMVEWDLDTCCPAAGHSQSLCNILSFVAFWAVL